MTEQEIEARAQRAVELFKNGYNCSQAVFASCADIYGITDEALALRLSASFGGGMGRMRMVCGAASGMFMLAGLHNGSATPHDNEGKMANYAFVQQLAGEFKGTYGSLICAELLGLAPKGQCDVKLDLDPRPAERTPEYYQKRPCSEMVAEAVRIYLRRVEGIS
ncbi:MAG: C_GCAxxG_C_C family protein [Paludibacteraceae bacterium]|nr:C_GCAxxG_C_C family protein [Paludibacteraceae bacterium]